MDIEQTFSSGDHLYGRIDIDNFSVSGCGSQMDDSTKNIRENLYNFLKKYNIKSIADIPCGDFWWMRHVDLFDINYIGGDIITPQITKLKYSFPENDFQRIDLRIDKRHLQSPSITNLSGPLARGNLQDLHFQICI